MRLLGGGRPNPSVSDADRNPYAFERAVRFRSDDGSSSVGRIDLYKRGSFVLEAKQSLQKGGKKELKFKDHRIFSCLMPSRRASEAPTALGTF